MKIPMFSDAFQSVMRNGSKLSSSFENYTITSAHILAGTLELEGNTASEGLLATATNKANFLKAVYDSANMNGKIPSKVKVPTGSIVLTNEAEKVVMSAQELGKKSPNGKVEIRHLINAMLLDKKCIANSILINNLDIAKVKSELSNWID